MEPMPWAALSTVWGRPPPRPSAPAAPDATAGLAAALSVVTTLAAVRALPAIGSATRPVRPRFWPLISPVEPFESELDRADTVQGRLPARVSVTEMPVNV